MPWKQCKRCGWWQKHAGPCIGCVQSSKTTPVPQSKPHLTPTTAVLQDRWNQAKRGSQDPKHTKVERMCPTCFLRTVGKSPTCRGCQGSLDHCLQIFPCQWPPIGASAALLAAYDASSAAGGPQQGETKANQDEPMPEECSKTAAAETHQSPDDLADLNPPQLRAEIARLESVLHGWQQNSLPGLRKQLEETLTTAKRELASRRSTGRTLDQAESRYKQTQQAAQLAEQQLQQAQKTVAVAADALRQARDNEHQALQELSRLKAQIAEATVEPPLPRPEIPPQVLAGVFAVLQHAGLQPEYLEKVGSLLGQDLPPPPPPVGHSAENLAVPAQQQQAPPGVLTQLMGTQARLSQSAEPLRDPTHQRIGRSPPRRALPKRMDLTDYADTAVDSGHGNRDTSRTPDRDAKVPRHEPPPSSLQGVAPPATTQPLPAPVPSPTQAMSPASPAVPTTPP